MRFQKSLVVLGLIFLISFTFAFVGCGSDDDTPMTGNKGSLTDPEFMAVQAQIEIFVDSTVEFVTTGLVNISAISAYDDLIDPLIYGPSFPDSDYVSSTYANGWHVVSIVRSRSDYLNTMNDSVQFFVDGTPQQSPDGIDAMYYSHKWLFTNADTSVSCNTYEGHTVMNFTGLDELETMFNGSQTLAVMSKFVSADSTVWRDFEFDADYNSIVVAKTGSGWMQGCPSSGSISMTLTMEYSKDDAEAVSSTWLVTVGFEDGVMTTIVRKGNVSWNYSTDICMTPAS